MTQTPEDKAIEKIANFINERPLNDTSPECAAALIDLIGIEFVDDDSKPEVGDVLRDRTGNCITIRERENLDLKYWVTIQRNDRPVKNVDEMGV